MKTLVLLSMILMGSIANAQSDGREVGNGGGRGGGYYCPTYNASLDEIMQSPYSYGVDAELLEQLQVRETIARELRCIAPVGHLR